MVRCYVLNKLGPETNGIHRLVGSLTSALASLGTLQPRSVDPLVSGPNYNLARPFTYRSLRRAVGKESGYGRPGAHVVPCSQPTDTQSLALD